MPMTPTSARQVLLERLRERAPVDGHEIVARSLALHGITHVYGVPGRPVDATLAACVRTGLKVIGTRHQQGATLMSVAHNYVAGGLRSAVIVSAGPAVTNTTTGVLVAHDNRFPLLVIGGRHGLLVGGERAFQAFDGVRFMKPIVKHATLVERADDLAARIAEACRVVMQGAPGPAYLDAGAEALADRAHWLGAPTTCVAAAAQVEGPSVSSIREAAACLAAARRPVLLVGKGVRWSRDWEPLRRLVDERVVPFAAAPMARGFLPDDHPLCVTTVRGQALADADLVVLVGGRFNWTFHYGVEIPTDARIVRIDIDPAEATDVLGRGVALTGDAATTLRRLLEALSADPSAPRVSGTDTTWVARLQVLRTAAEQSVLTQAEADVDPMSPFQWLREVRDVLPPSAITVLDGNVVMSAAQWMLPVLSPVGRLTAATNGCMGAGIPFAIGAKLASPTRPVVAICGDFGFGLSGFELETAVRYKVPLPVIVSNNGGPNGAITRKRFFPPDCPDPVARYGAGIRHESIMEALGGRGIQVRRRGELGFALREALASDGPTCIDVLTNEDTALSAII